MGIGPFKGSFWPSFSPGYRALNNPLGGNPRWLNNFPGLKNLWQLLNSSFQSGKYGALLVSKIIQNSFFPPKRGGISFESPGMDFGGGWLFFVCWWRHLGGSPRGVSSLVQRNGVIPPVGGFSTHTQGVFFYPRVYTRVSRFGAMENKNFPRGGWIPRGQKW